MVSGYPRFFIHLSIQKVRHNDSTDRLNLIFASTVTQLAQIFEHKYGVNGESCMLFPTHRIADQCRTFLKTRSVNARLIHLLICPEDKENGRIIDHDTRGTVETAPAASANLHIALFPANSFSVAKEFWQHTGMGISSRLAEHCLSMLPGETTTAQPPSPTTTRLPSKAHNRHYSAKVPAKPASPPSSPSAHSVFGGAQRDELSPDHSVYMEERYGRNLPLAFAASAKRALRRRVAGVLIRDSTFDCQGEPCAGEQNLEVGPSSRGISDVSESDVFLFPTGMSAIWNAHNLALSTLPPAKSVCFGYVLYS